MTLTPPAEIMGRVHAKTCRAIIHQRAKWIADQYNAGNPYPEIATALGISTTATRTAANRYGYAKPKPKPVNITRSKLTLMGMHTGNMGNMFFQLPIDQQNRLIDLAIARKTTIANALVAHYLETAK